MSSSERTSVIVAVVLVGAAVLAGAVTRTPAPPEQTPPPRSRLPPVRPIPGPAQSPMAEPVLVGDLEVTDRVVGAGEPLLPWQIAVVELTWWGADGAVVDSTSYAWRPGRVVLHAGQPSTFDDLLPFMRVGGLRTITGPELGWMDVTLVDALEPPTRPTFRPQRTLGGLAIQDLRVGEGPVPEDGRVRVLELTTWTDPPDPALGGDPLDSTLLRGTPLELDASAGLVFEPALDGMRVGGRRLVRLEPDRAFGADGVPPLVPPGAAVLLDVRLMGDHLRE
ncbi:MAG: FKBP-type peptidyl-prolyl cis-trans isomerase [Alphaproteobacteria bacterium]|nr:FKBP-type peptidyl-prolyl cis-trans isomerase [Alphaproteobacteria bacterium]MCB9696643.1 FKBP-type peptidyl-prolyl cis-trans isomerase [Alphaproteobacteria bacterium]